MELFHQYQVYSPVTFDLWQSLTWTSPQMFDIYLLLFHAGRLSHETRVVVRVPICAAHWVFIVAAAVDFTRTAATSKRCDDECDVCVTHNMTIRPPAPPQHLKQSFVSPWWSMDHSLRTHSKLCVLSADVGTFFPRLGSLVSLEATAVPGCDPYCSLHLAWKCENKRKKQSRQKDFR